MSRIARTMQHIPRVTITMDDRGAILGIRADEDTEIYIVDPHAIRDRVYQWTTTRVGRSWVDDRLDECIVHLASDKQFWPM